MNGRTPTIAEARYMYLSTDLIGCLACIIDGRGVYRASRIWVIFHHNEHEGSRKKRCHFHGCGLCATHHTGANAKQNTPVRHPGRNDFRGHYGDDYELCLFNWVLIQQLAFIYRKHMMDNCPFPQAEVDALDEELSQ